MAKWPRTRKLGYVECRQQMISTRSMPISWWSCQCFSLFVSVGFLLPCRWYKMPGCGLQTLWWLQDTAWKAEIHGAAAQILWFLTQLLNVCRCGTFEVFFRSNWIVFVLQVCTFVLFSNSCWLNCLNLGSHCSDFTSLLSLFFILILFENCLCSTVPWRGCMLSCICLDSLFLPDAFWLTVSPFRHLASSNSYWRPHHVDSDLNTSMTFTLKELKRLRCIVICT